MKYLFDKLISVTSVSWCQTLERLEVMVGVFNKIQLIIFSKLTKSSCISVFQFAVKVRKMRARSGSLFVALYLKAANTALMTMYGGDKVYPLSFPISLTGDGLPRVIPTYHRVIIRRRDSRSDLIVKFYLSLFSLSRAILLAKKIKGELLQTIRDPISASTLDSLAYVDSLYKDRLPSLLKRYAGHACRIPCKLGMTWQPSWKTLPTYSIISRTKTKDSEPLPKSPYIFGTLELRAFASLVDFVHQRGEQVSQLWLWPERTIYPIMDNPEGNPFSEWLIEDSGNKSQWRKLCTERFAGLECLRTSLPASGEHYIPTGRLAECCSGGGKRRLFAIGNLINQRLLSPIHNWLMSCLQGIPMDGTFNQISPFMRLIESRRTRTFRFLASYDLSAATDRFPLRLLFRVIEALFGVEMASSAVNSALASNLFEVCFMGRKKKRSRVRSSDAVQVAADDRMRVISDPHEIPLQISFVAGQPLGYLSSWPLFSLSHHCLVWLAADLEYPGQYFDRYALLGDDIVIADERVAHRYVVLCGMIGVSISIPKSLISSRGSAEFAKRFFVRDLTVDLSPISFRALLGYAHPYGLLSIGFKYPMSDHILRRLGGFGYRSSSSLRNRKFSRLSTMRQYYRLPLSLWLGRGLPLLPYQVYFAWQYVQRLTLPKEPNVPIDLMDQEEPPGIQWGSWLFIERTWIRGTVKSWLTVLKDYYSIIEKVENQDLSYMDGIEALLRLPVLSRSWHVSLSQDCEIKRFGHTWKLYDKMGSIQDSCLCLVPLSSMAFMMSPDTILLGE